MIELLNSLKEQEPFMFREIFEVNAYNVTPNEFADATVIDIGANAGFFTVFSLLHGAKHVVAVEAVYTNFIRFLENTKQFRDKITPILAAIYHESGKIVELSDKDFVSEVVEHGDVCAVTITLNDLMKKFHDIDNLILKMDIEGSEYNSLLLASTEVFRRFKSISIETHKLQSDPHLMFSVNLMRHRLMHCGFSNVSIFPMLSYSVDQHGNQTQSEMGTYIEKWVRL